MENSAKFSLNGQEIDLSEILSACGNKKIEAVKRLKDLTGLSLSEAKKVIDAACAGKAPPSIKQRPTVFRTSKRFAAAGISLNLDDFNKKWQVSDSFLSLRTYDYSDLLNFEVTENGNSVMQGKAGGTIIGALTFGIVGAMIGSAGKRNIKETCSSLQVNLMVNDLQHPNVTFKFIKGEVKKDSYLYKSTAKKVSELVSILTYMQKQPAKAEVVVSQSTAPPIVPQGADIVEQIQKFAELNKQGILTDEEFAAKKKQLLGI